MGKEWKTRDKEDEEKEAEEKNEQAEKGEEKVVRKTDREEAREQIIASQLHYPGWIWRFSYDDKFKTLLRHNHWAAPLE